MLPCAFIKSKDVSGPSLSSQSTKSTPIDERAAGSSWPPLLHFQDGGVRLHDSHDDPVDIILQAEVDLLLLLNCFHELQGREKGSERSLPAAAQGQEWGFSWLCAPMEVSPHLHSGLGFSWPLLSDQGKCLQLLALPHSCPFPSFQPDGTLRKAGSIAPPFGPQNIQVCFPTSWGLKDLILMLT